MTENEQLIEKAYLAFNARDIGAVLSLMQPDVKWPRAWQGDYVAGHDNVCAYWQQQWQEIDPIVTPVTFVQRDNGQLAVEVDQLVKDLEGNTIFNGRVVHVYNITGGLIKQMDIEIPA